MVSSSPDYVALILSKIENFGILGYWMVLLIAFLEAVPFVGTFVPGATLIVLTGLLSAQGYLVVGDLIFFAAIGAIVGDCLGYYFGTKGTRFFQNENKLLKLSHLEYGKAFFKDHGNKSIILGRFISPTRSIIPFIAGLSGMDKKIFLLWDIVGGFIWATSHLLFGYYLGAALEAELDQVLIGVTAVFLAILIIIIVSFVRKRSKGKG